MKYLVFFEYDWKDLERIGEISKKVMDERSKGSDKFLRSDQVLFLAHALNAPLPKKSKDRMGFFVCETENEETLINLNMIYADLWDLKFIPVTDARKTLEKWIGVNI